jgi:hypothetical protein
MYIGLHVKYMIFCQILMKLEFSGQIFEKNTQISNFMKIHRVGAEFFHADGQIDMTKLIVAFRNSAHTPKTSITLHVLNGYIYFVEYP